MWDKILTWGIVVGFFAGVIALACIPWVVAYYVFFD